MEEGWTDGYRIIVITATGKMTRRHALTIDDGWVRRGCDAGRELYIVACRVSSTVRTTVVTMMRDAHEGRARLSAKATRRSVEKYELARAIILYRRPGQ